MARKTREAKPVEETGGSELAAVMKDISRVHGDKVVMTADMKPSYKHIPFGIFSLDMATFGGLPEGACTLLYGWESSGKALDLTTPIPTPDGWSTMGDLQIGDIVFDEKGAPCRVIFVTEVQHGRECFEVEFFGGEKIVCDAEHLWYVESRYTKSEVASRVLTTKKIAADVSKDYGGRVRNRWRVPVAGPLQTQKADVTIHPYALGVWLGDGHIAGSRLTLHDNDVEIIDRMINLGYIVYRQPVKNRCTNWQVSKTHQGQSFCKALDSYGLRKEKHIPQQYFRASYDQRVALLCGLMDTDGYAPMNRRSVEFCTTSERLYDDVVALLFTLGIKSRVVEDRARLNGVDCGLRYRVCFDPTFNPFWLKRKAQRVDNFKVSSHRDRSRTRSIIAVRPVPSVAVRCIQVDSHNHLYLAGRAMIPTHNTTLALRALAGAQRKHPQKRAVMVEPEGTLDPVWATTHGVDISKLILVQPTSGEQAFDIARAMIQAEDVSMVCIDSLASLVPNTEIEKSMEDNVVGTHAKLIARFCRTIQRDLLKERTRGHRPALLMINQWRNKIGVIKGDPRVLPGGVAQHYAASVKIDIKNREMTKDKRDDDGHSTVDFNDHSFAIKKNKMGVGLREGEFKMCRSPDHPLGMGTIDDAPTVVTWCRSMGHITGSGSSWHVQGIDHRFKRLQEIADHFYDTPEFYEPLKRRLIEDYREKIGQPRGYL